MANVNEVIDISSGSDSDIQEISPPPAATPQPVRMRGHKRRGTRSPPVAGSTKRMRSEHPVPPNVTNQGDAEPSTSANPESYALVDISLPLFKLPETAHENTEAVVHILLNEEESQPQNEIMPLLQLRNFTFFEGERSEKPRRIIGLHCLEFEDRPHIAGYGEACVADKELDDEVAVGDDEASERQYYDIYLEEVLDWWSGDGVKDFGLYIRTPLAWYRLEEPAEAYRTQYRDFWIPHRLTQIMAEYALKLPNAGLDQFYKRLAWDDLTMEAKVWLGRTRSGLTQDDVLLWGPLIYAHFQVLQSNASLAAFFSTNLYQEMQRFHIENPTGRIGSSPASKSTHVPRRAESKSIPRTVVTPLVARIAQRYYRTRFEVLGPRIAEMPKSFEKRERKSAQDRKLPFEPDIEGDVTKHYYKSVNFEGNRYREVGDCVAVPPGTLRDYAFPERPNVFSETVIGKDHWYGIVRRIYKRQDPKTPYEAIHWAHIQWFVHGVDTDIGELAAPNELFLTHECNDIGLALLDKVVDVKFGSAEVEEIIPEKPAADTFFCRFLYSEEDGSFRDVTLPPPYKFSHLDFDKMDRRSQALRCEGCIVKRFADRMVNENAFTFPTDPPNPPNTCVNIANVTYHLNDTVLYISQDEDLNEDDLPADQQLLSVGLVIKWDVSDTRSRCLIRRLRCMDEVLYRPSQATDLVPGRVAMPLDERRLFLTGETIWIHVGDIMRHCVVRCKPQWSPLSDLDSEPSEFFLTHSSKNPEEVPQQAEKFKYSFRKLKAIDPRDFPICDECNSTQEIQDGFYRPYKENAKATAKNELYLKVTWMKTLDLCAGAGGLSKGFDASGAFNTLWAVEKDLTCAKTFKANFRRTKVYTQDLNECARNVLTPNAPRMESLDPIARGLLPPMPDVGRVDAIIAGPPCPDFSIQNMYLDRAGETRTGLPLVVLSMIEHYRPRYFLLENVPGMLRHSSMDQETGKMVSMAIIKIILRTLTTLGYSVRYGIFNAANYGAPQDRTRFLIYGAKGGNVMPKIPLTSHITMKNSRTIFSRFTRVPTKLPESEAPNPPINVAAAIGDLPPFEWTARNAAFPPRADVLTYSGESPNAKGHAGFVDGADYKRPTPASLYQARMREHMQPGAKVALHYTRTFAEEKSQKAARVVSVPLRANMDHRNIPAELYDFAHSHSLSAAARTGWAPGRYGRLDWQGLFQSAITRIEPTAKQGKVLHPSQRRLISIREAARAQGLPDHFVLKGNSADMIRMIGNAVPTQLGHAFGRVFRDAMIAQRVWEEQKVIWPLGDDLSRL